MMFFRRLGFLLLGLSFVSSLAAQTGAARTISGKVIDQETKEPIAFVYILLANDQDRGVLSNENGEYILPYSESSLNDTILVSRLGYKLFKLPLQSLRPGQQRLVISLESSSIQIDAITVRASNTPEEIIRTALSKIVDNYGYPRSQAKAFYRQYGLRNGEYTDITEAYVTIRDITYRNPSDKSFIYLDHLERTVYDDHQLSDGVFSGENPIYSLYEKQNNSARYHHIHWMSFGKTDFFEAFDFSIKKVHLSDRDTIVEISYQINPERAGLSEAALRTLSGWTRGEVAINTTDYGIIRNIRGDANGNVFSEVYYSRAAGRYYPSRITSIYAIEYGEGEYFVTNRMLFFTSITNIPKRIKAYDTNFRLPRKKGFGEITFENKEELSKQQMMLRILAPEATSVDADRREYQRTKLGVSSGG